MTQADRIILRFGGIRPLARALSTEGRRFPPTTVQGWTRGKGYIPAEYHGAILSAARATGIDLTADEFIADSVAAE